MTVHRVTITGADDNVDPEALARIADQFPIVEWGVLFSASRAGTPRYPSAEWVKRLLATRPGRGRMDLSAHLCGSLVRDFLGGFDTLYPFSKFGRVQLNGWGTCHVSAGAYAALRQRSGVILQSRDEQSLGRDCADAEAIGRHTDVLFDVSGGTGKSPVAWPSSVGFERLGFAGGINPSNVRGVIDSLGQRAPYWIDMESGVRNSSDRLDLKAVEEVLSQATIAWAQAQPTPSYLRDM